MREAADATKMFKNSLDRMGHSHIKPPKLGAPLYSGKYLHSPSKCSNKRCRTSLKNKKKYSIEGIIQIDRHCYTPLKRCRRCGHLNIASVDRRMMRT